MTTDIIMPNLGFDSQENRLVEWLKQPGEPVQKGEPIAIVESDKANVELESIAAGVLLEQLCRVDEIVLVGAVIARIGSPTEAPSHAPTARVVTDQAIVPVGSSVEAPSVPTKTAPNLAALRALPKVRQAAREAGISLAAIAATDTTGIITLADLRAYQARHITPAPTPLSKFAGEREIPLSKMRRLIGQRLGESKRAAPHFYVTAEFDLEQAVQRLKGLPSPQPGLNDLMQYLTVQTLRQVPELNAVYEDDRLYQHQTINLAIAVAQEDGLITPVIKGAERYSLAELAAASQPLIKRAQANRLQADDLQQGTFTVSNLGVIPQVDQFTAVINPPQVAILAVGAIKPRPIVIDGGLYVHHTVHLTLSGDHRVLDGLHLGRFMAAFQAQLDYFNREDLVIMDR